MCVATLTARLGWVWYRYGGGGGGGGGSGGGGSGGGGGCGACCLFHFDRGLPASFLSLFFPVTQAQRLPNADCATLSPQIGLIFWLKLQQLLLHTPYGIYLSLVAGI